MESGQHPRVSIGLPVYNGERHVGAAIDSILAQTYTDFELIISDNASTDATPEICRAYAARDPRVRSIRHAANIGAQNNHNLLVHRSTGRYFKWAGHDDVLAPTFLERCVEVLDQHAWVVNAFTGVVIIDDTSSVVEQAPNQVRLCAPTPHERLRRFFAYERVPNDYQAIYGVIRADVLKRSGLQGNWYGSDRTLLQELSLYGCFYRVEADLFFYRDNPKGSGYAADKAAWTLPQRKGRVIPGYWKHLGSTARMLLRAPMSPQERLRCLSVVAGHSRKRLRRWLPILTHEVVAVARQATVQRRQPQAP